jgi:hypothetical protein
MSAWPSAAGPDHGESGGDHSEYGRRGDGTLPMQRLSNPRDNRSDDAHRDDDPRGQQDPARRHQLTGAVSCSHFWLRLISTPVAVAGTR